jgi:hypothetical protein
MLNTFVNEVEIDAGLNATSDTEDVSDPSVSLKSNSSAIPEAESANDSKSVFFSYKKNDRTNVTLLRIIIYKNGT